MSPSRQRAEQEGGQSLSPPKKRVKPKPEYTESSDDSSSLSDDMAVDRAALLQPATRWPSDDDMAVDRAALLPATRWPSDDEAPRRREDSPLSEEFESEDSSSSSEAVRLRLPPRRAERRREVRPRRIVDSDSEEDSSSSGLGGGAEITKNLYSVQVQMIKKVVNEEKVFLDYEIHRELKKDNVIYLL